MHAVTQLLAPFSAAGDRLTVRMVPAAEDNLVWVLSCNATGESAVIDGPEASGALALIGREGLTPTSVFNTHTHWDHIGINQDLQRRGLLPKVVAGPGSRPKDVPGITQPVGEGDVVRVGEVEGRVMLTEGHIDGHVSFVFDDVVFCGDTMFGAGCGYLFDGPPRKMFDSLHKLAALGDEVRVCCAHEYTQDNLRFAWSVEPDNEALAERIREDFATRAAGGCTIPSTIGREKATSPFLRSHSPSLQAAVRAAFPERELQTEADFFAATRALKDSKRYRERGDADLPL